MIRSMTGFGEAEGDSPAGRLRVEVKTVNHRFFNTNIKTPSGFDRYEQVITEAVKRHVSRGHVSVYLSVDRASAPAAGGPEIDLDRARAYQAALEALRDELELPGAVDLALLSRFGDLFRTPEADRTAGIEPEMIDDLVDRAASAARSLREAEGLRLAADFGERLAAVEDGLASVEARAPERLRAHGDRLRESVRELSGQVEVDDDRLAREIAYLADRLDLNEELVRFRSHVELFREAIAADGSEPVGKRLGFLVQEMHREANTIASKANDAEIAHASVALKEEIERMREQVENVE